ncbi:cadherin-like domain-containing protein, partial [Crocosphaera watsonii]|uniref:cadherin-like domain-containing protein n=3 Tax=Crocosphaera watsonii TaxID=263511 RepID=UPI000660EC76
VTITVDPVNNNPVAVDEQYSVNEDETLTIAADGVLGNDTDIDGDALTSVLVTGVSNGSLTLNTDGSFEYTPDADFSGIDTFTYRANDGELNSNIATVTITVDPEEDAPVATGDQYSVNEAGTLTILLDGVLRNDIDFDGDTLTSILVDEPTNGILSFNANGSFEYTPDADFSGIDTFTYRASDGVLNSDIVTVIITVDPVSEPPVFGSLDSDILDAGITPGFDGTDNIAFSGSGDDLIDVVAGTGDNRLYGQSGNDTLTLGGGDRAFGGSGDDQFFLLGGNNAVTGGLGADQFWIANAEIPESRHIITDFNLEDDLLNIAGLGVGSFSDLTLSNEDGNALIAFDDNELATLLRVDADSLTADNFGVLS